MTLRAVIFTLKRQREGEAKLSIKDNISKMSVLPAKEKKDSAPQHGEPDEVETIRDTHQSSSLPQYLLVFGLP